MFKSQHLLILVCIFSFLPISASTNEARFFPSVLLKLDPIYNHHILVAEKSTHKLHLFKNNHGLPELVKTYEVATGKNKGNKFIQGDHRTPEGVYRFTDFLNHQDLIKRHGVEVGAIYGVGAFVMDYPNPVDIIAQKTGGGIWLHSTNDEPRIDNGLDSRGCIVSTNKDLIELSQYLELQRSSVVVVQDLKYLEQKTWEKNIDLIDTTLNDWLNSWRALDIERYLSFYNTDEFYDPVRKTFSSFKAHKRAVFKQPAKPNIDISSVSYLASGLGADDYVMVTFLQHYESQTLKDLGRKTLYLKRDKNYQWKIVAELWSKHGVPEEEEANMTASFTPSMRFFETRDPAQILQVDFRERKQ